MGERSIAPMGHVRMMAAVQPFLSGAISKTVNMPESATVEDVEKIYFEGWKLGLKALAIYRDNCKVGQPLSAAKKPAADGHGSRRRVEKAVEKVVEYRPVRKRLPKKRPSQTMSFSVGGAEGYLTAASYPDDGLGEVFIKMSQAGLDAGRRDGRLLGRDLDRPAVRRAAGDLRLEVHQHALRAGRPDRRPGHPDGALGDGLPLPPAGAGLPAVRAAAPSSASSPPRSGPRSCAPRRRAPRRRRGLDGPGGDGELGTGEPARRSRSRPRHVPAAAGGRPPREAGRGARRSTVGSSTELLELVQGKAADAPLCFTCGTKMRPAGSCYVCEGCGSHQRLQLSGAGRNGPLSSIVDRRGPVSVVVASGGDRGRAQPVDHHREQPAGRGRRPVPARPPRRCR